MEHAKARFKLAVHDSIRRVGKQDPQAAFMLLSSAGIHALDFMMNTTKPGLIQDILSDFDGLVDDTRPTLLRDEDIRTACTQSPLRLKLAGHIASLQLKSGGLGHTRAVQLAPVRYLCSIMNSASEPALCRLGKSLLPSIRDAHARVCDLANIDPRNLDMP